MGDSMKKSERAQRPKSNQPGVKMGYKKFGTTLPVETCRRLKIAAAMRGVTVQKLLIDYADTLKLDKK